MCLMAALSSVILSLYKHLRRSFADQSVAAGPVRRGLHAQVLRFPVLGVGEPPGPVLVVNVTLLPHLLDLLLQLLVKAGLLLAHPGLGHLSVCCLE